jgi:U3 small nucleolar RNA-associated protein 20
MVAELGAGYLTYAAEVLQGALPDKGYTAQVRGYTLHALLDALAQVRVQVKRVY